MKKILFIALFLAFAIVVLFNSCKKSDEDPPVVKNYAYYGWAVGAYQNVHGFLLHTQDGGSTWKSQSNDDELLSALEDICIIDRNTLILVGDKTSDGTPHVLKSSNGGENWSPVGTSDLLNVNYTCVFKLDEEHVFIVGDSGCIYRSDDTGESWMKIVLPDKYKDCLFLRIAAKSLNDIWVVGDYFQPDSTPIMLHTMDGGASWTRPDPIKDLNITSAMGPNGHYLAIKLFGNSIWAMGGFGGFILLSTDNGNSWEDVSVKSAGDGDANDLFLISETEAYAAYDYGGFYSTSDTGKHWTQYYPGTNDWLLGIAIQDEINIWVCGSAGGAEEYAQVLYSKDAGTSWIDQTPGFMKNNLDYTLYKIRFMKHEWKSD